MVIVLLLLVLLFFSYVPEFKSILIVAALVLVLVKVLISRTTKFMEHRHMYALYGIASDAEFSTKIFPYILSQASMTKKKAHFELADHDEDYPSLPPLAPIPTPSTLNDYNSEVPT